MLKPVGRVGSRRLKKLLQEYGVPSWQRGRIPILYYGEQVALVAGLFVCDGFLAPEGGIKGDWRAGRGLAPRNLTERRRGTARPPYSDGPVTPAFLRA